ncbi:MAG: RDD family protein [Phycisphaerae bacterium]|nr:RDD family protein [Phycisphaerae bacterium]
MTDPALLMVRRGSFPQGSALAALIVLVLWCCPVRAEPQPAAAGMGWTDATFRTGHAWMVLPTPGRGDRWTLHHLPPRHPGVVRSGSEGPGAMHAAWSLGRRIAALAARDDQVFLMFHPEAGEQGGAPRRSVLSLRAVKGAWDGWGIAPAQGPRMEAALLGSGSLHGFVGSPCGPVALLKGVGAGPRSWGLFVLMNSEWIRLDPAWVSEPDAADRSEVERAWLVPARQGFGALVCRAGETARGELWLADMETPNSVRSVGWTRRFVGLPARALEGASDFGVFWVEDRLIGLTRSGSSMDVWSVTEREAERIGTIGEVPVPSVVLPLEGLSRLVVAWAAAGGADAARGASAWRAVQVCEWSVATGREMFRGPAHAVSILTPTQIRALGFLMLVLIVLAAATLMRPGARRPVTFAAGVRSAPLRRRSAAMLADIGLVGLIAAATLDMSVRDLFIPLYWGGAEAAVQILGRFVLCGWLLGTVAEGLLGQSLGKLVCGCGVADARRPAVGESSCGLVQSALRNALKWSMPPLLATAFFDAQSRHAADVLSGTQVVVRDENGDGADSPDPE